ncbi:MAG: isochorismatase family protein [Anaerolineales bacterium]|nr:isochorismatase family protein [Anaerolineales bacterium]
MKEAYYSPESIERKAQEFCQQLEQRQRRRLERFIPRRSALLALDMQAYFFEPASHAFIPSAPAIVPGIQALVRLYLQHQLPVIFTRHLNTPENAASMATWWKQLILPGDPLSEIIPSLDLSRGVVVHKSQYDAFYHTSLEDLLRSQEVSQVVICGVMTHLCCETTARSAFMRGYEVFFTVDGTATYNAEHHWAALLNLAHGFATPALTQEIAAALEGKHAG